MARETKTTKFPLSDWLKSGPTTTSQAINSRLELVDTLKKAWQEAMQTPPKSERHFSNSLKKTTELKQLSDKMKGSFAIANQLNALQTASEKGATIGNCISQAEQYRAERYGTVDGYNTIDSKEDTALSPQDVEAAIDIIKSLRIRKYHAKNPHTNRQQFIPKSRPNKRNRKRDANLVFQTAGGITTVNKDQLRLEKQEKNISLAILYTCLESREYLGDALTNFSAFYEETRDFSRLDDTQQIFIIKYTELVFKFALEAGTSTRDTIASPIRNIIICMFGEKLTTNRISDALAKHFVKYIHSHGNEEFIKHFLDFILLPTMHFIIDKAEYSHVEIALLKNIITLCTTFIEVQQSYCLWQENVDIIFDKILPFLHKILNYNDHYYSKKRIKQQKNEDIHLSLEHLLTEIKSLCDLLDKCNSVESQKLGIQSEKLKKIHNGLLSAQTQKAQRENKIIRTRSWCTREFEDAYVKQQEKWEKRQEEKNKRRKKVRLLIHDTPGKSSVPGAEEKSQDNQRPNTPASKTEANHTPGKSSVPGTEEKNQDKQEPNTPASKTEANHTPGKSSVPGAEEKNQDKQRLNTPASKTEAMYEPDPLLIDTYKRVEEFSDKYSYLLKQIISAGNMMRHLSTLLQNPHAEISKNSKRGQKLRMIFEYNVIADIAEIRAVMGRIQIPHATLLRELEGVLMAVSVFQQQTISEFCATVEPGSDFKKSIDSYNAFIQKILKSDNILVDWLKLWRNNAYVQSWTKILSLRSAQLKSDQNLAGFFLDEIVELVDDYFHLTSLKSLYTEFTNARNRRIENFKSAHQNNNYQSSEGEQAKQRRVENETRADYNMFWANKNSASSTITEKAIRHNKQEESELLTKKIEPQSPTLPNPERVTTSTNSNNSITQAPATFFPHIPEESTTPYEKLHMLFEEIIDFRANTISPGEKKYSMLKIKLDEVLKIANDIEPDKGKFSPLKNFCELANEDFTAGFMSEIETDIIQAQAELNKFPSSTNSEENLEQQDTVTLSPAFL